MKCPARAAKLEADPGKATTKLRLPTPVVFDNSQAFGGKLTISATLNGKPVSLEQELELGITYSASDYHQVKYVVKDEAGNEAKCWVFYRIEGEIIRRNPRLIDVFINTFFYIDLLSSSFAKSMDL